MIFNKNTYFSLLLIPTILTPIILSSCTFSKQEQLENDIPPRTGNYNRIENEQEEYINKNSLSLAAVSDPNINYLKNYFYNGINSINKDVRNLSLFLYSNFSDINNKNIDVYNVNFGTGWVFDYSQNTNNLIDFYIASNIHVYNSLYSMVIKIGNTEVKLSVPVSQNSVNYFSYYMCQPIGGNVKNNTQTQGVSLKEVQTKWYRTNINKFNVENNIIPIGASDNNGNIDNNFYDGFNSYDFLLEILENNSKKSFLLNLDQNNNIEMSDNYKVVNGVNTTDFGLLKISMDQNTISKHQLDSNFKDMMNIFNIKTNLETVTKKSSYISKLNKLIYLAENGKVNTTEFNNLFLFECINNKDSYQNLSVAGFPIIEELTSYFNANTFSSNFAIKLNEQEMYNIKKTIPFYNKGKIYYSWYDYKNNWIFQNVNLGPGSSGSFIMTNNYKITSIYWGILINKNNEKYGISSNLYSKNDPHSVVNRYLKYANKFISSSNLLKLFKSINN